MQTGVARFSAALAVALFGCSSSKGSPKPDSGVDASACDGAGCTQPPHDGGQGGAGGSAGSGGSSGTFTNLCPNSGPVTGPLPSGVAIAFDLGPTSNDDIAQLLVNDSVLLWRDSLRIARVSLSDSSTTIVLDRSSSGPDDQITAFAIDDQNVYFSDSTLGGDTSYGLAKYPLSGTGTPTTIVNNPHIGRLVVSGGYIYYEDEASQAAIYQSAIVRVPTSGGTPTVILRGVLGGLQGLAVGGGYVYFMGTIGVGSYSNLYVARVPITAQVSDPDAGPVTGGGGADAGVEPAGSELVATTGLETSGVVTDATNVYWGDEDMLMMAPLAGGSPSMLAQAGPIGGMFAETAVIEGIAPHGASIYWSSFGCEALWKTTIADGTTVTVVPYVSAGTIQVNSTHIYFTPDGAQVLSAPL